MLLRLAPVNCYDHYIITTRDPFCRGLKKHRNISTTLLRRTSGVDESHAIINYHHSCRVENNNTKKQEFSRKKEEEEDSLLVLLLLE
jgi:hypothetical protein